MKPQVKGSSNDLLNGNQSRRLLVQYLGSIRKHGFMAGITATGKYRRELSRTLQKYPDTLFRIVFNSLSDSEFAD